MAQATDRRTFLKRTSQAAAVTAAASTLGGVHAVSAEKPAELNLALIGCGGIMNHHAQGLANNQAGVVVSTICDVDPSQLERISGHFQGQSVKPKRVAEFEDVLADKSIDAVVVATPHHWHAPIGIQAMEAGKDLYVEKPISHVYYEGQAMIDAAKKYKRIVQHGSQMRSSPVTEKAGKLLADGIIGEVKVARAWTAELRQVVKPVPDSAPPTGVNYDRWLGPAPKRAFNKHRFHSTWRMYRDYGNGEIGDDGIHDLDMAAWGLGVKSVPKQVTARGGRMMLHGHASEYPDNMNVTYEFPDGRLLIYENYPFTGYGMHGFDNGNVFYGTKGYMIFSRRGAFSVFLGNKNQRGPTEGKDLRGQRGYTEHMTDFLTSVRTRRPNRATPELAHYSCTLVHFGEIAFRTEGRLEFDAKADQFVDSEDANALLGKDYRKPYLLPEVG